MSTIKNLKVGAACDFGVHLDGAALGPKYLLNENDSDVIILRQKNIVKSKDPQDKRKNFDALYDYCKELYQMILSQDAKFVTMVGGDHSLAVPSILASVSKNPKIGLIWIDAHSDYHTLDTTSSGNLHGLPCACVNNYGPNDLHTYHQGEYISACNTVIYGARSVDDLEWVNLKENHIHVITMEQIKKEGILKTFNEALKIALCNTEAIHVSFDLDFLDPSIAPAVSTPVKQGANQEELQELMELLSLNRSKIQSFDLVEFNPKRDIDDQTLKIAQEILNIFNERGCLKTSR